MAGSGRAPRFIHVDIRSDPRADMDRFSTQLAAASLIEDRHREADAIRRFAEARSTAIGPTLRAERIRRIFCRLGPRRRALIVHKAGHPTPQADEDHGRGLKAEFTTPKEVSMRSRGSRLAAIAAATMLLATVGSTVSAAPVGADPLDDRMPRGFG